MVEEITIDDARDYIYTALRACERFAGSLKKVADELDKKQNDEEWLELVQTNCGKAISFHEVQENAWQQFSMKMEHFVDALRQEADALAVAEIKGNSDGEEFQTLIHRRESKTLHPELHKFKLEKQAKILGMGGAPAVGSGMVLPRLSGKGSILKATGSAAAREIYYSKVEEKDARYLADVMQFHAPKSEEPQKAAWQQEVQTKHIAHRGSASETTPPPPAHHVTPLSGELSNRLAARAAKLEDQEEVDQATERMKQAGVSAIPTTPELAAALRRRQAAEATQAVTPYANASTPPPTTWTNATTPYGSELSSTLARRAQQQAEASPSVCISSPVNPMAGAGNELSSLLARRQSAITQSERTPPPHNQAHQPSTPMSDMVNSELAEKLRWRQMQDSCNT